MNDPTFLSAADTQALRDLRARSVRCGFVLSGKDQALMFKAAKVADARNARDGLAHAQSAVSLVKPFVTA